MKKTVFITGVTGSIGAALAKHYARLNHNLILHARNEEKLAEVAIHCRDLGVEVQTLIIDLADSELVVSKTRDLLTQTVPDIFIANAGLNINHGNDNAGEQLQDMEKLLDVNVKSTLMMTNLVAKAMRSKGRGQIALISSLAGFFGLPVTPSYSASKAAIRSYGEALRGWLKPFGVGVTVVMPGYIQSDMCDEMPGPKPFLLTPERAAEIMQPAIANNKARVSFPFPLNLGTWFLGVLPVSVSLWILQRLKYSNA